MQVRTKQQSSSQHTCRISGHMAWQEGNCWWPGSTHLRPHRVTPRRATSPRAISSHVLHFHLWMMQWRAAPDSCSSPMHHPQMEVEHVGRGHTLRRLVAVRSTHTLTPPVSTSCARGREPVPGVRARAPHRTLARERPRQTESRSRGPHGGRRYPNTLTIREIEWCRYHSISGRPGRSVPTCRTCVGLRPPAGPSYPQPLRPLALDICDGRAPVGGSSQVCWMTCELLRCREVATRRWEGALGDSHRRASCAARSERAAGVHRPRRGARTRPSLNTLRPRQDEVLKSNVRSRPRQKHGGNAVPGRSKVDRVKGPLPTPARPPEVAKAPPRHRMHRSSRMVGADHLESLTSRAGKQGALWCAQRTV